MRGALAKGYSQRLHQSYRYEAPQPLPKVTLQGATAKVQSLLGQPPYFGESDAQSASPVRLSCSALERGAALIRTMFEPEDYVNWCSRYGRGRTQLREDFLRTVSDPVVHGSGEGISFRLNPVTRKPSGDSGGYTDRDLSALRYGLVENDLLPLELQLPLLAALPLPIAAIIFSGNRSLHAVVKIDARDVVDFKSRMSKMLALLRPLGFDTATVNPSRMSRLPGALRGDKLQRLLYLNPAPAAKEIA